MIQTIIYCRILCLACQFFLVILIFYNNLFHLCFCYYLLNLTSSRLLICFNVTFFTLNWCHRVSQRQIWCIWVQSFHNWWRLILYIYRSLAWSSLSVTKTTQVSYFYIFRNLFEAWILLLLLHLDFLGFVGSPDTDLFVGIFDFVQNHGNYLFKFGDHFVVFRSSQILVPVDSGPLKGWHLEFLSVVPLDFMDKFYQTDYGWNVLLNG